MFMFALLISEGIYLNKEKTKPHCYICNDTLWTKHNQNQLFDTWTCNNDWSRAEFEARENLGDEYLKGRTDMALKQEIHRVIRGRKPTYRNTGVPYEQ